MATIYAYEKCWQETSYVGSVETGSGKVWGSQKLRESLWGKTPSGHLGLEGYYTQENDKTLVYTARTFNKSSPSVGYVDAAGKLYDESDRLLGKVDKDGHIYRADQNGHICDKENPDPREYHQLLLRVLNDKGKFEDVHEGLKTEQEEISAALLVKVTGAFAILCMGVRSSTIIQ